MLNITKNLSESEKTVFVSHLLYNILLHLLLVFLFALFEVRCILNQAKRARIKEKYPSIT